MSNSKKKFTSGADYRNQTISKIDTFVQLKNDIINTSVKTITSSSEKPKIKIIRK